MMGEDVRHLNLFVFAMIADIVSKNVLRTGLVGALVEVEAAALLRLLDAPAREHLRQLGDVLLRVAAVHTEGVKFHDFASVIFIQAAGAILVGLGPRGHSINRAEGTTPELRALVAEHRTLAIRTHAR